MSNGAFLGLKLTDKLLCQGSVTFYGLLRPDDLLSIDDDRSVEDQESLTFSYARVTKDGLVRPITAQMRPGRVIRIVWGNTEIVDEWRVSTVESGRGASGVIRVTCVPIWFDLVERSNTVAGAGFVSELHDGERVFDFEIAERTATSILTDYLIPNVPSYIALGTVEPTNIIPALSVNRLTPWALALAVRDELRSMDVPCELQLRSNGTTNYLLDLVTQVGASASIPVFHPDVSLLSLIRSENATLQATRLFVNGGTAPDGFPGVLGRARWRGAAPSGLVIALTDRNGGASPIAFDGQWVGNYLLRVKTGRSFLITDSDATLGTVTLEAVSTIAADEDFEFRLTEPLTNVRTTTTRYDITAVGGSTITLAGDPIIATNQYADWYAKVWSASSGGTVIATTRIATTTTGDVLTVASVAGVTTSHWVEFVQLDGAGEVPVYVDHPLYSQADPIGYGVKVGQISRPNNFGITELIPNSWMREWANPSNPPDGYTEVGSGGFAQETTITRYGGFGHRLTPAFGASAISRSKVFYPNWDPGHTRLSLRAWVQFVVFTTDINATLKIYAAKADGTPEASIIAQCVVQPMDGSNAATKVDVDVWVELKIEGLTLEADTSPFGMILEFDPGGIVASFTSEAVVDTMEAYPFLTCPLPSYEFGDSPSLLQAGNRKLAEVATPPVSYTMSTRDLEQAFPDDFPRLATTIGGQVRAVDSEYGVDVTIRLLRRTRSLIGKKEPQFTLANRPTRMTNLLQAGVEEFRLATQTLVVSGTAPAVLTPPFVERAPFQTFGAPTTVTDGNEVTTPDTAPVLTVDPGASVTYVPASTADPSTTVTAAKVGAPPRPRVPARTNRTLR